jgi:hypothetical protein
MPKNRVDPSTSMVFDRPEAMTARTGPCSRDEGVKLVLGNSCLEALDQVLAIVMGETQIGLRLQIGPFNVATIADCKLPASSIRSSFTTQFIEVPSDKKRPNHIRLFSPDPQLLSALCAVDIG